MGPERLIGLPALVMHQGQCLRVSLFVFFKYTSDYTNTLELLLVKKADRALSPYKKEKPLRKSDASIKLVPSSRPYSKIYLIGVFARTTIKNMVKISIC